VRLGRFEAVDGVWQVEIDPTGGTVLPPRRSLPGSDPPLPTARPLTSGRLLAPVRPGKIVCIGRNYRAHAAELGNTVPSRPLLFHKPASAVIGPGATIQLPPDSDRVEHEAELGVVIGRRARHLALADALDAVLGFTCLNDVTARDLQRSDKQFARGKGFDTFCPLGPWIETEFDPADVRVSCTVGDEVRQDGRTGLMVFDVATLLATISRVMTLEPGDVIATGTPAGVGPLTDGDVVRVQIEGLGVLENLVRRDSDVPDRAPPIAQAR
jgi:2-keto-4-pentenoate hydratase/2-oxohepta-3-ene-1,7-dioic acid hydratase in catechol pathway